MCKRTKKPLPPTAAAAAPKGFFSVDEREKIHGFRKPVARHVPGRGGNAELQLRAERLLHLEPLVAEHAEGTRHIYRLNEAGLSALRDQLDTFWSRALSGFADLAEQPEEKQ